LEAREAIEAWATVFSIPFPLARRYKRGLSLG
jgi:hypothetical protein